MSPRPTSIPTQDGLVLIAANQDTVFGRLCDAMGRPDWPDDPRFGSHQARGSNQKELDGLISDWTRSLTTRQVLDLMDKHGVPAGQIYRAPEMLEDPHFQAREAIVTVDHPQFGKLRMQNIAPKLSETPGTVRSPSPALGQHNDEVYLELLEMPRERYEQLRARKVI